MITLTIEQLAAALIGIIYVICFFSSFFCFIGNKIDEVLEWDDIWQATVMGIIGPLLVSATIITIIKDLFFYKKKEYKD